MKTLIAILVLIASHTGAIAQKIIEKSFPYSNKKQVELEIRLADSISIQTWSKQEVSLKASVSISDNKYNDEYVVTFNETAEKIRVDANIESKRENRWSGDSNCCRTNIYWTIYVPEKAPVKVNTINGDITITGKTSTIDAHSISGFIDMLIPADLSADFRLSTITGTVYSDVVKPENSSIKKNHGEIVTTYKGGGTPVKLKTISGNIFLREKP